VNHTKKAIIKTLTSYGLHHLSVKVDDKLSLTNLHP